METVILLSLIGAFAGGSVIFFLVSDKRKKKTLTDWLSYDYKSLIIYGLPYRRWRHGFIIQYVIIRQINIILKSLHSADIMHIII